MSAHGPDELAAARRLILAETRASLMSDTKWRKMIEALDGAVPDGFQCVVRFFGAQAEQRMELPSCSSLWPPRPWVDSMEFGPFALRGIDWLLLPYVAEYTSHDRTIPVRKVKQDVDEAERIIKALGLYPIKRTERGLLITGHLPA